MSLSIQEKKFKVDFQDGNCGSYLGFPIRTILAVSLSTSYLDDFYQFSNELAFWFMRRSEKIDFQAGHQK